LRARRERAFDPRRRIQKPCEIRALVGVEQRHEHGMELGMGAPDVGQQFRPLTRRLFEQRLELRECFAPESRRGLLADAHAGFSSACRR
jgi:hypothetical protein